MRGEAGAGRGKAERPDGGLGSPGADAVRLLRVAGLVPDDQTAADDRELGHETRIELVVERPARLPVQHRDERPEVQARARHVEWLEASPAVGLAGGVDPD